MLSLSKHEHGVLLRIGVGRYMKSLITVIVIVVSLFVSGCADCNCDEDMDDVRAKHGSPEEVNTYSSSDYHSESWWYWSKGVEYTFAWGSVLDECCDVSKYTFTPITDAVSDQNRVKVENGKVLELHWITPRDCITCQ